MQPGLGRIKVTVKSGDEWFHSSGAPAGYTLLDFWRWSVSDLVSNATRGRLAEFIVAKALGIPTHGVRDEWAAYDLISPDGVRVEVKSAAYMQSWAQKDFSTIQFVTPKTRAWDPDTNLLAAEVKRQADVYVFAVLSHKNKATVDPLNLSQWSFYVLPTATLDARTRSQHSITLKTLKSISGAPVGYQGLGALVAQVGGGRSGEVIQPDASPNGGPATSSGHSIVTEGPPSVS
jgi:hypothetical protein